MRHEKKAKNREDFRKEMEKRGTTPQGYLLDVLTGKEEYDENKYQAAKDLLPYVMPKLQSIEAENVNINMSHEEALKQLQDAEGDE